MKMERCYHRSSSMPKRGMGIFSFWKEKWSKMSQSFQSLPDIYIQSNKFPTYFCIPDPKELFAWVKMLKVYYLNPFMFCEKFLTICYVSMGKFIQCSNESYTWKCSWFKGGFGDVKSSWPWLTLFVHLSPWVYSCFVHGSADSVTFITKEKTICWASSVGNNMTVWLVNYRW